MQLLTVKVQVTLLPAFETCFEFTLYLCRQWLMDYTHVMLGTVYDLRYTSFVLAPWWYSSYVCCIIFQ